MIAWLNGELPILYSSCDELLLSCMIHLFGGGVYLINFILVSMFCEFDFEGLVYEMKLY